MTGSPLVTIARDHVGQLVTVFTRGHRFAGTLVRVADDGQALRLADSFGSPIFIDLLAVEAIITKEDTRHA